MTEEPEFEELTPMEEDCPCGSHDPFEQCCYLAAHIDEVEEELLHLFRRHPATSQLSELETIQLVEAASELIWPTTRQPMLGDPEPEGDEVTRAELYAISDRYTPECRYCANTGHFYSEPDLGPCVCQPEDELDLEALIG